MCPEHLKEESPALPASKVTKDTLEVLNGEHSDKNNDLLRDTIFVVEDKPNLLNINLFNVA